VILDTTFLHDLMYGNDDAVEKARELDQDGSVALSSMTVYELYYGVGYTDKGRAEKAKVDSVIGSKQVLPSDTSVMRKAGKIDGRLSRDGEKVGQADIVIGATAILHDRPVLTRNVAKFERIPGIEVETY
jgi:predicted nucleic acid-binding protein